MRIFPCLVLSFLIISLFSCTTNTTKKRVIAIPVYGQSLALGEEASRITDFDSLATRTQHLVVTDELDEKFGYFADSELKQWSKKVIHDQRRSFELSIYGMAEAISKYWIDKGFADSLLLCTFPGGQGATPIADLSKGSHAYQKFIDEIKAANQKARDKGWDFVVPAFCWMQGENDMVWDTPGNYKEKLRAFRNSLNTDIKSITGQKEDVACICYQTNCITLAKKPNPELYASRHGVVPQAQLELIREDPHFVASGPTYLYDFVDNGPHIDGLSQKRLGYLAGLSAINFLEGKKNKGLIPLNHQIKKDTVIVEFNVPVPPLQLDTQMVSKANHFGFSVIDADNTDILTKVIVDKNSVKLCCKRSPAGAKIRYAINGLPNKTGRRQGARGNLRDSQGEKYKAKILDTNYPLHNWCYQFDMPAQ